MDGHKLTNADELTAGGVPYTTHVHDGDNGGVTSAPKAG
jgi:hypothetical protein